MDYKLKRRVKDRAEETDTDRHRGQTRIETGRKRRGKEERERRDSSFYRKNKHGKCIQLITITIIIIITVIITITTIVIVKIIIIINKNQ
uniref:Uncharacterized protein n=1 Tax=Anguilla anguilla TaxID=7936 RepID=A0A0E9WZ09_ANGAN